jgi:hypothetical protein
MNDNSSPAGDTTRRKVNSSPERARRRSVRKYKLRRKNQPVNPPVTERPVIELPGSFYRPATAGPKSGQPARRPVGIRRRNRDAGGRYAPEPWPESDVKLTDLAVHPPVAQAEHMGPPTPPDGPGPILGTGAGPQDADRNEAADDGWEDSVVLPRELDRLSTQLPGWSEIVHRFWACALEASPSAVIEGVIRDGRYLRILTARAGDGDQAATALIRQEADFLEAIAASICSACGATQPLSAHCTSRFGDTDWN